MIDDAEGDWAVMHHPAAILALDETHWLANQRFTQIDFGTAPADRAIAMDPPRHRVGWIFGLAQDTVPVPRRAPVELGRSGVAERGMRALLIIEALKIAEPAKLLAQAARRRVGGIAQQGQMQPFEPTVLLRFAGGDALRPDPCLDDLDRQPRQSAGAGRGKWRPVVRAQSQRQTKLQKRGVEHRPDMLAVSAPQRLAAQQVPAVGIAQGQRFAVRAIAGQKPALKVDAPHRIGIAARGKWGVRWRTAPAQLAFDRQSFAVEQLPDRTRRRPDRGGIVALEPGPHLDRPPAAMRLAHRQAAFGDRCTHRLRVRMRRPRPFAEPLDPLQPISLQPFVAGLARQLEAPAQRRHLAGADPNRPPPSGGAPTSLSWAQNAPGPRGGGSWWG